MQNPGPPFSCDYVYITIDCGDCDLIDDVQLQIKASTSKAMNLGKTQKKDVSWDDADEFDSKALKEL